MQKRTFGPDGRYTLNEEVGEGGFAHVFRATDEVTKRNVALKVLKEAYTEDPQVIERWNREVFAIASLESPHVVTMYDFGLSDENYFISMEYLEGPTLREVIKEPVWEAEEVRRVIGQIAQGLSVAHRRGILHRDLKPENIKLLKGEDGHTHVKVLDFGFAKLAELEQEIGTRPVTRVGTAFGTPHYMSPEQALGKNPDQYLDLYALGVITYEILAGRRPFGGKTPQEVMRAVVSKPMDPIETFHPSVTRKAELNAFLGRALAKDQTQRPSSAAEFFLQFERALLGADDKREEDSKGVFGEVIGGELKAKDGFVRDTMQVGLAEILALRAKTNTGKLKRPDEAAPGKEDEQKKVDSGWHQSLEPGDSATVRTVSFDDPPASSPSLPAPAELPEIDQPPSGRPPLWLLAALMLLMTSVGLAIGLYVAGRQ
jgi:serine/threonine protein kinase